MFNNLLNLFVPFLAFFRLKKTEKELNAIKAEYKDIPDVKAYLNNHAIVQAKLDKAIEESKALANMTLLKTQEIIQELAYYETEFSVFESGLYIPIFNFDTSIKYKENIISIRNLQKELIKEEKAAICSNIWSVNGSAAEGKKQVKQIIKLILRAFNGECDSLISDVKWNNVSRMFERINKIYDEINKIGASYWITISTDYLELKRKELSAAYEYQDKLQKEKEEQKRIQEEMREEEKARREYEKALKEAEDEEKRYSKALEQAKKDMEGVQGEELLKLQAKMEQLQRELQEAQEAKQRTLSMAQLTKAGHVYVISNIGSFGENIYKIGMTRRLEPMDRVKELGDASVPFEFDVHAIIYSENAPELEKSLHKEFDFHKVNLVNDRREFFHVSLKDIEKIVKKLNADIEFVQVPEAREYRESITIREKRGEFNLKREFANN